MSPPSSGRKCSVFHTGFLLGLFSTEDGGDMFLRNAERYIPEAITVHNYQRENFKS
jgi:hypothetical protein